MPLTDKNSCCLTPLKSCPHRFEMIHSMVPEDHKKQLANLKKTRERQKRQQRERGQVDSDEEESDNDLKKSNGYVILKLICIYI